MGRSAREAAREATSASERLEAGFALLEEELDRAIAQMDPPEDLDAEERAGWIVARLREREDEGGS